MFFHEYFADFDRVFGVFEEIDTFNDRELYNLDPKLNLTLTALLRKVPILYGIGKKILSQARMGGKKIYRMPRVKILLSNLS